MYKIYSVWLYQNQLKHDWVFFYNRERDYTGRLSWNPPYYMFGSSDMCASNQIYNMDKSQPDFLERSVRIMKAAADKEGILLVNAKDYITLCSLEEGRVSYQGALPGDIVETEGEYSGLKKMIYTPYDIIWNETKSGINPHEWEVMGVWQAGSSQCSTYRIWEEKDQRDRQIRNNKLECIL